MGRFHIDVIIVNRCICGHHHTRVANAVYWQERPNVKNQIAITMSQTLTKCDARFAKIIMIKSA